MILIFISRCDELQMKSGLYLYPSKISYLIENVFAVHSEQLYTYESLIFVWSKSPLNK